MKQTSFFSWNAIDKTWTNRKPPVSSSTGLDFSKYVRYMAQDMIDDFRANTTPLTKKLADGLISKQSAEETLTVKEALKKLSSMDPNTSIKITYIK